MAKTRKRVVKGRKKIWVRILAPKIFNEQVIGESPVYEKEFLLGKKISVNLMTLTRDMKKQSIVVQFEITAFKGANAETKIIGYKVSPASVKRMMRRCKDKIEQSFVVKTKDNIKVRIKPLVITRFASSNSVRTALRREIEKTIIEYAQKNDFLNIANEVISSKFQKSIKYQLHKIQPINIAEIRVLKVES